jgi:hypothetical protein
MKTVMMIATMIALSASAHAANLTGTWKGAGSVVSGGQTTACPSVVLTISHTASALSVKTVMKCDGLDEPMEMPGTMKIQGADLIDASGKKAGSISGNEVSFVTMQSDFIVKTNAKFNDKSMNLGAVISTKQKPSQPAMTFSAELKR